MIDLDDFDRMGKQWMPGHQDFQNNVPSERIAEEALRVAALMLRACNGCCILPDLHEILWEYYEKISTHSLWSPTLKEADATLYENLDQLSKKDVVCDKRIEAIALRSAKRLAIQLREEQMREEQITFKRRIHLGKHLASLLIQDLIGHSFLDISRALSVGKRFATSEQSFQFYEEVMAHIKPGADWMGRRLIIKPTAERLRPYRVLPNPHTTGSILWSSDLNIEL